MVLGNCTKSGDNMDIGYPGISLITGVIFVPLQALIAVYVLYHLLNSRTKTRSILQKLAAMQNLSAIYVRIAIFIISIGNQLSDWSTETSFYCTFSYLATFPMFSISFWFLEIFWLERLRRVFKTSIFEVDGRFVVYFYVLFTGIALSTIVCYIFAAVQSDCVTPYKSGDFNPFGNKDNIFHSCGTRHPGIVLLASGVGARLFKKIFLLMHLICSVRSPNTNELNFFFKKKKECLKMSNNVLTADKENSYDTTQMLRSQIQKCAVTALLSITVTVASVTAQAFWGNLSYPLSYINGTVNAFCVLCSFKFGEPLYQRCFFCCAYHDNTPPSPYQNALTLASVDHKSNSVTDRSV
ncbi:hypothetical protein RFI_02675 [Reticulomyxa filosa]|uniref:Uncharacterized protein n=1 Tax=Reticulomyxa filosa TaxID=46433 RepID=X6P8I7_RETFI|nr:hypothetical protein RFI_02675 [Reticulomyxa filosa]|eukprot:ETO34418.1 hypothetical protein RFI_02675 [Reticulomyxa filosa]